MIDSLLAALISAFRSVFSWTATALNVHNDDVWPVAVAAPVKVVVTQTNTQSAAITGTRCLVWCNVDVWYTTHATNPVAVADFGDFLPAWSEREVSITSGHKFGTIRGAQETVDGSLWIRVLA